MGKWHSFGVQLYNGILIGSRTYEYNGLWEIHFYIPFISFFYSEDTGEEEDDDISFYS